MHAAFGFGIALAWTALLGWLAVENAPGALFLLWVPLGTALKLRPGPFRAGLALGGYLAVLAGFGSLLGVAYLMLAFLVPIHYALIVGGLCLVAGLVVLKLVWPRLTGESRSRLQQLPS
ncbi:MAG: hypothetical protein ACYTEG_02475 [Planctomycetota bacterium]|jgi:hypothetical protein